MQTLFSPDSKLMQAMSRVCDLAVLNLIFLICCIPVFTIGAASTALYTVCFRFGTEQEGSILRDYFRAFRSEFRQSTLLWLLLLLCGGTAWFNGLFFYRAEGVMHCAYILFAVASVLVLLAAAYVFPLLSQFRQSSLNMLKNAVLLSIAYLPRSILATVLNALPFFVLIFDLYLFLQIGFLWIALYFSAAAYLNTLLLKKVFAPYLAAAGEGI